MGAICIVVGWVRYLDLKDATYAQAIPAEATSEGQRKMVRPVHEAPRLCPA